MGCACKRGPPRPASIGLCAPPPPPPRAHTATRTCSLNAHSWGPLEVPGGTPTREALTGEGASLLRARPCAVALAVWPPGADPSCLRERGASRVVSCRVVSCRVVSCRVVSCRVCWQYVTEYTQCPQIGIVGFSQGTAQVFAALSTQVCSPGCRPLTCARTHTHTHAHCDVSAHSRARAQLRTYQDTPACRHARTHSARMPDCGGPVAGSLAHLPVAMLRARRLACPQTRRLQCGTVAGSPR